MPPEAEGVLIQYTLSGTNEQAIIDVLTKRSNAQRQQIAKSFKAQFGKVSGWVLKTGQCLLGWKHGHRGHCTKMILPLTCSKISLAILFYLADSHIAPQPWLGIGLASPGPTSSTFPLTAVLSCPPGSNLTFQLCLSHFLN